MNSLNSITETENYVDSGSSGDRPVQSLTQTRSGYSEPHPAEF